MRMKKNRKFTVINGTRRKKSPRKIIYLLLILATLAFGIRAAYFFTADKVTALLLKTVIGDMGELENVIKVNGLIVRDEHPVAAPVTGTVHWLVKDGERLAVNIPVASISAADGTVHTVVTPFAGIVVRQLDGLEGMLQPQALDGVNVPQLLKTAVKHQQIEQAEAVPQGSMLFKVVNNFSWCYLFHLPDGTALPESDRHRLRFSFAPGRDLSGRTVLRRAENDSMTLAYEFTDDVDGFLWQRQAEAEIITGRIQGVILPLSALVEREGETGVFTLEKSVVRYRSVEVVGISGELVAVDGLRIGLRIITNPDLVREGRRL
jgi:putative membrane fusion protein